MITKFCFTTLLLISLTTKASEIDIDAIFSKKSEKITIPIDTKQQVDVNRTVQNNADAINRKQKKFLVKTAKYLFGEGSGNRYLDQAIGYCAAIGNGDGYNSCMASLALIKGDTNKAAGWCYTSDSNEASKSCLVGIELYKGNISMAKGMCWNLKNKDNQKSCLAGIELTKENVDIAAGYCWSIKNDDAKQSCLAGIELSKRNISGARAWCTMIKEKSSKYACLSDTYIVQYIIDDEPNDNFINIEIEAEQITQEVTELEDELSQEKLEAMRFISEIEANPSLLEDPEIQEAYIELKRAIS